MKTRKRGKFLLEYGGLFWVALLAFFTLFFVFKFGAVRVQSSPKVTAKQPLQALPIGSNTLKQNPTQFILPPSKWIPQTYNNCAPATVAMLLQHYGINISQEEARAALRTNPVDRNVFTPEIKTYLKNSYSLDSVLGYNGNITLLKTFIAHGFPVLVEDWLHPNEDIGHDLLLRGYDDSEGVLIADDSYLGAGIKYKYTEFDATQWKAFNREYFVVYQPSQESIIQEILQSDFNQQTMFQHAVDFNNAQVLQDPVDVYAWFNLGSSYAGLGNYQKAKSAFDKSRALTWPGRMLWYQYEPVEVYNKVGEYQTALELAQQGLKDNDSYSELHYEAAVAYQGLGQPKQALAEVQQALHWAPLYTPAKELLSSLKNN